MKKCSACKKLKPLKDFSKNRSQRDGYAHACKDCNNKRHKEYRKINKDILNAYTRQWRKNNPERVKELNLSYYELNGDKLRMKQKVIDKKHRTTRKLDFAYRKAKMFSAAKYRAKKKGLDFDISIDDLIFPEVCPVLGIDIDYEGERNANNIPSLDRINSSKGYVKGNVRIISNRANHLKLDASSDELIKVLEDLKKLGQ